MRPGVGFRVFPARTKSGGTDNNENGTERAVAPLKVCASFAVKCLAFQSLKQDFPVDLQDFELSRVPWRILDKIDGLNGRRGSVVR